MNLTNFFAFLAVGSIAGWLAGLVMRGRSLGLVLNLVIGVIGAFLGGYLLGILGLGATNVVGSIITAFAGAVVLLFIIGMLKKI